MSGGGEARRRRRRAALTIASNVVTLAVSQFRSRLNFCASLNTELKVVAFAVSHLPMSALKLLAFWNWHAMHGEAVSGGGAWCDGAGYAHRQVERRDARGIPLADVAVEVGRKEAAERLSRFIARPAHVGDLRDVPVFDLGTTTAVVADPFDDRRVQRRAVGEHGDRLRQRRGDREEERVAAHRLRRAVPRCAAPRDSLLCVLGSPLVCVASL